MTFVDGSLIVATAPQKTRKRYRHLGRNEDAKIYCLDAYMIRISEVSKNHSERKESREFLMQLFDGNHPEMIAELQTIASKFKQRWKKEGFLKETLSIAKSIYGEAHLEVANILTSLAKTFEKDISNQAEKLHEEACGIYKKLLGEDHSLSKASYKAFMQSRTNRLMSQIQLPKEK